MIKILKRFFNLLAKKQSASKNKMDSNVAKHPRYQKPDTEAIKAVLTEMQYNVTQNDATEPALQNEYYNNKRHGIYVDIVSGEPLFSSRDKYESHSGWPSFTQPLVPANIIEKQDDKLFTKRTEVRSRFGDSHLGHVFNDGPQPTGMRYCINSASLRFIPESDMEKQNYGEFLDDVAKSQPSHQLPPTKED